MIGEYGDTERRPVNIVGASQSELRWMGPLTDAPMLSIYGGAAGSCGGEHSRHLNTMEETP